MADGDEMTAAERAVVGELRKIAAVLIVTLIIVASLLLSIMTRL